MIERENHKLISVYRRYGFVLAKEYRKEGILVFTLKTGYFDNADIVPMFAEADPEAAFKEFTSIGFACTVRQLISAEEAEKQLFRGFFSVDSTRERLASDYKKFTSSIVAPFSENATYSYINAPYLINGKEGQATVPEEVLSRMMDEKPTLFLIEAAAGFGKTCTAYELVHHLASNENCLPLYAELSRNRQARIFRHILLDEIDRTFPLLGSGLVQTEIKNGRVVTILDGFDELLRKHEETGDFENREPMLETISEFLTGRAKIILTTRRTVLFDGDEFHKWLDRHTSDFELVRIKISEPRVSDWLPQERLEKLEQRGLSMENIANPVLLSYLRCIPDPVFDLALEDPDYIVDSYFTFMLEREQIRQDLRMDVSRQKEILLSIAKDMIDFGYTAEERDYIVDFILKAHPKFLEETQQTYSTAEKPSKEELSNKLASHALLDRSSIDPSKISFINEFVFGEFIAKNILNSDEWLNDDLRFIEPAVLSYLPREQHAKDSLWGKLEPSLSFLDLSSRIDITAKLVNAIGFELIDDEAEGMTLEGIVIGSQLIKNFQFNECRFINCQFNIGNLHDVNFLNCRFYDNAILPSETGGSVYVLACIGDQGFIEMLHKPPKNNNEASSVDITSALDRFILEKFWPIGKDKFVHLHRPIKVLCSRSSEFTPEDLYKTIISLKKRGFLNDTPRAPFVSLNTQQLVEIKKLLNRNDLH